MFCLELKDKGCVLVSDLANGSVLQVVSRFVPVGVDRLDRLVPVCIFSDV